MFGKETHLRYLPAHVTKAPVSTEQDHPQIGSWGNSPLSIKGPKTLIMRRRGVGYMTPKGITEAGFRPLLRQLSCTHQSAAPCHTDF